MALCCVNGRILVAMTRTVITAVNITRYQLPVFVHLSMVIISMNLILRLPFRIFAVTVSFALMMAIIITAIAEVGNLIRNLTLGGRISKFFNMR